MTVHVLWGMTIKMKEKEIIINGIDVSECKYFNKVVNEEPYCNIDEEHLYTCSSDENCYYKQLKRAELAFENLKRRGTIPMVFIDLKLIDKYKQALEEIREIAKYSIMHNSKLNLNYQIILKKIDEALNE